MINISTVLPNMGLVKWDAGIDNFSHSQLAQNWINVDGHDHTFAKGMQVGPGGVANLSIGTAQLADGSVTDGKISLSSPITDTKLASSNNLVYRTLLRGLGTVTSANTGTGPYFLGSAASANLVAPNVAVTTAIEMFYLAIADYAVPNKSPVLQVAMIAFTNNVAPGVNFTAGLNLVTVDSGHATSGNIAYAAGSRIANSTALIPLPAQNSQLEQASVDFIFPADNFYALCINMSGTPGVGSFTAINTQLRIRYV